MTRRLAAALALVSTAALAVAARILTHDPRR